MFILRITSFIVLFLSVAFFPWPVTAGLAVIAMALFSWPWEIIIIGFLLGAVYGFENKGIFIFLFFVLSFSISLLGEECFKKFIQGENIISRILAVFSGASIIVFFWLFLKISILYF